jgi:hypothetical protein
MLYTGRQNDFMLFLILLVMLYTGRQNRRRKKFMNKQSSLYNVASKANSQILHRLALYIMACNCNLINIPRYTVSPLIKIIYW